MRNFGKSKGIAKVERVMTDGTSPFYVDDVAGNRCYFWFMSDKDHEIPTSEVTLAGGESSHKWYITKCEPVRFLTYYTFPTF